MADVKISALPAVTNCATTDVFALVQGGVTYRGTLAQMILAIPDASGSTRGLLKSADWTTFNGKLSAAITSLGGLTGASQTLGTGTTGTDFAIVSSGTSHTFNLPTASATNRGALSSADWSTFNGKLSAAITSLGGLTGASQTLATGTTGTDFAIVSSGTSHTFNIPDASATARGLVSTGTQTLAGNKTIQGDSATVGNVLVVQNSTPTAKLTVANAGRITIGQDSTVTTQTSAVITTDTTNAALVLKPNGTGALIAATPDGASTGGNARGNNAIDFQFTRNNANNVASGVSSSLIGGQYNKATAECSTVIGGKYNTSSGVDGGVFSGQVNTASGIYAVTVGGNLLTASGARAGCFGGGVDSSGPNVAAGDYSTTLGGQAARSVLYNQASNSGGRFSASSDSQYSRLIFRREITGTSIAELTLDGSTPSATGRAILNISSPGPTNARAWRAQIDVVAICDTVGNGTGTQNDVFAGSYHVTIKRVGTATSLVGAVSTTNEVSDTSMSTSVTTITADDTNESLKIEFTPPSGTAGSTSVYRVVATAYLTEVGR